MYNKQEIKQIQNVVSRNIEYLPEQVEILREEFYTNPSKKVPVYVMPFIGLFVTNKDLYQKVINDKNIETFSMFGFFPETFDLVYDNKVTPQISLDQGNRGLIVIMKHPNNSVVIKPFQNSRELEVASVADELGVGPKQYRSLDGFLTEEYVESSLFSRLEEQKRSPNNMYNIGRRMGDILKRLHSRKIFYNDTILTDDFRRSHLFVTEDVSQSKLFDYGVALKLDNHPNYSNEEILNYCKTFPMVNMFLERNNSRENIVRLIEEFTPKIKALSIGQIMSRDLGFISEGISFASYRYGHKALEAFSKGFEDQYN